MKRSDPGGANGSATADDFLSSSFSYNAEEDLIARMVSEEVRAAASVPGSPLASMGTQRYSLEMRVFKES